MIRSLVAVAVLVGCAPSQDAASPQSRVSRGDTVVVISSGAGVWGAATRGKEVRRVTGAASASTFGRIEQIAAMPDGGVVVFDAKGQQGPAVHQFDPLGRFVRTVGGLGRGPGEYATVFVTLATSAHGEIVIHDKLLRRITHFDSSGRYRHSFVLNGTAGRTPDLIPATAGGVYVASDLPKRALVRFDSTGRAVDSVSRPDGFGSTFTVTPAGELVVGRTDLVGFLLVADRNRPLMAELRTHPPEYRPGEREELQSIQDQVERTGPRRAEHVVIPQTKALSVDVATDLAGRIWIRRTAIAQKIPSKVKYWGTDIGEIRTTWEEPPRYAIFERDGSYLGEMEFPLGARIAAVGCAVWAVIPGTDDEPILVKYSIGM